MLGIGATSRIGFWLWYLIPLGALLAGTPVLGGLIYGTYGLVRGWSVWPLLVARRRRAPGSDPDAWLLRQHRLAQLVAATQMLLVAVAVVVAVGL